MKEIALGFQDAAKSYGDRQVLGPVSFEVPSGQQVALVGANGSGKTTILRLAAGLLDSTEGSIEIYSEAAGSLEARAALGYLPDEPVLYEDLSVTEHVDYLAPLFGATDWSGRRDDLINRLGLENRANDLPSTFSRGLRQKTSLLLGFVRPARILLIDEPFVGLDAAGRAALLALLDEAKASGVTVIMASHQLDLLGRSDRCIGVSDGQIIFDGPAGEADLAKLVTP